MSRFHLNRNYVEELPLFAGARLRDKGIKTVTEHNESWMDLCVLAAEKFVAGQDTITGEDIRFQCERTVGYPNHHNAWGALINTLLKREIIVATGEYRPMRDDASHARSTPVYTAVQ